MQRKDLEVFDRMPFNFFVKDGEGRYVWVNQQVLQLANLASRGEIIGKTDDELIWADDADRLRTVDREVFETGKTMRLDEHVAKSGSGSVTAHACKFVEELDGKKCLFGVAIIPS